MLQGDGQRGLSSISTSTNKSPEIIRILKFTNPWDSIANAHEYLLLFYIPKVGLLKGFFSTNKIMTVIG